MIQYKKTTLVVIFLLFSSDAFAHGGGSREPEEHHHAPGDDCDHRDGVNLPLVLGYHAVRGEDHWEHTVLTGFILEQELGRGGLGVMLGINWSPIPGPTAWLWYEIPERGVDIQLLAVFDGHWDRESQSMAVHGGFLMGPSFESVSIALGFMYWSPHDHEEEEHHDEEEAPEVVQPIETDIEAGEEAEEEEEHHLPPLLAGPGLMIEVMPAPNLSIHLEAAVNVIGTDTDFEGYRLGKDYSDRLGRTREGPEVFLGLGAEWYF